jgi:hypothetical protein
MRHAMMEFDWTLTKSLLQQYLDTQQQQQQHGLQAHHAMHVSDESVVRALTRETDMIKRAIDVGLASDGLLHCLQNEVRITGTNFEFKYIFSFSYSHTCSYMFMHVFMHVLIHVLIHLSGVVWFARRSELFSFELEGVGNSVGQHHSSDGGKVRQ